MKPFAKPLAIKPAGPIPSSITTPDKVESRIGTLEFTDGMPGQETLDKVHDHLAFTHAFEAFEAFEAFVNAVQGVSMHASLAGAGSCYCASTARRSRSSTKRWRPSEVEQVP